MRSLVRASALSLPIAAANPCAGAAQLPAEYGERHDHGPISASEVVVETPDGEARGWVAQIDLSWRGAHGEPVAINVTGPIAEHEEARLEATDAWAERVSATLAVNANFFGWLGGGMADVKGLAVSDGDLVSPARIAGDRPDPAVLFFESDGVIRADAVYQGDDLPDEVSEAVAGIGPSGTSPVPGSMLVEDGKPTGWTARVEPEKRHPRTAIGVSKDGMRVYLAVIDGRQPGWSVGLTLPELAGLMHELGSWEAVNLDGGGSSAFVLNLPGQDLKTNKPSGGRFRAVANSIGFRVPTIETAEPRARTPDQPPSNRESNP